MASEELNLKYWSESSKGYQQHIKKELGNYKRDFWSDLVLNYAPRKDKLKILDIGTGPGFFTITFTKAGHDAIGVDCTPEMLDVARANADAEGVNPEFKLMNANKIDFEDNTFDLIVNRNVTWTIPDMYDCYKEWRRVLAPGGKIIVFDANWYANHFDPEKNRIMREGIKEEIRKGGPLSHHSDFHVRDPYWEERPMIGTPRPEWDKNMLHKLKYWNIRTFEDIFKGTPMEKDVSKSSSITPMFMIIAEKPYPEEEDLWMMNEYWNGISPCLAVRDSKLIESGAADRYVEEIISPLPSDKNLSVLDIGTGCGPLAISLLKKGYDVVGLDSAEFMLEEAETCSRENDVNPKFVHGYIEKMPFEDATFDAVIGRNVVWLLPCPEKAFEEIHRVLRPSGKFIYSDGEWIRSIAEWEGMNPSSSDFPCEMKRDLGFGGVDVIDGIYSRLPLTAAYRPEWDRKELEKKGFLIDMVIEDFHDPLISDQERKVLGKSFIISAHKTG